MKSLRIILLTLRDLMGYCDPPFHPTWKYDNDPRLRWMIKGE